MRILYVTSVDATEGAAPAVHVRGTCQALSKMGHSVALLHAPRHLGGHLGRDWIESEIPVYWPSFRGGWRIFEVLAMHRLNRVVLTWRPDIIYLRFHPSRRLGATLKKLNIPTAIEINGTESLASPHMGSVLEACDLILADSSRLCEIIGKNFQKKSTKIAVHDTFVTDWNNFYPQDRGECCKRIGMSQDVFRIIHVSSFQNWHDFKTIYEALDLLTKSTNRPVEMVFLGHGEMWKQVCDVTATLPDSRCRILFPGRVPHGVVKDFIGASDLAVDMLSTQKLRDGKNLGSYKIYEYAACDRPVITAICADFAPPNWVRDTLALVHPEDPHGLAETIRLIMNNPEIWAQKARAAGRYVRENKTWERATLTTVAHLERMLRE